MRGDDWGEIEREFDRIDNDTRMSWEYAAIAGVVLGAAFGVFLLAVWLTR